MGKRKDCITEMDMFGHRFDLNFNKAGEEHKTFVTGFASCLIRLFIGAYVYLVFKRMILKEADNNVTYESPVDLDEYGSIDFMDSGMRIFHVIQRTKAEELGAASTDTEDADEPAELNALGYKDMMSLDGSLNRFVDIGYKFETTDATKGIGEGRIKEYTIKAKDCTADDLELNEEEAANLFALWANSTLICPDWDPDLKTLIKGDTSSRLTRNLVFEIEKCGVGNSNPPVNKEGMVCASPRQYSDFISDF